MANAFSSTFEYCYLGYSFARGFSLVVEVFPKIAPVLKVLFHISPLVLYVPVLLSFSATCWPEYRIITVLGQYLSFVSAGLVLSVESIVLTSFVQYLRRVAYGISAVDRKFVIVASYGIACVVLGFTSVGFYALFICFGDDMWFVGVLMNFTCVSVLMIAMKLALHEEEISKKNQLSSLCSGSHLRKAALVSFNNVNNCVGT
ncbi:hypothetical protein HDU84_002922 [Entophlyctis sp. JEL0112]|nr:hypothetical protein HDU84_002922 [Entophlyctis sp. JEL0112]